MRYALLAVLALAGCAQGPTPQARLLTPGTTPICLIMCFVTVHNAEAGTFPNLRQTGDLSGFSKATTQTSTVTATTP
jgi:hypothetical protein